MTLRRHIACTNPRTGYRRHWPTDLGPTARERAARAFALAALVACVALALLSLGCVSTATITLAYEMGEPGTGTALVNQAAVPQITSVEIRRESYGRDCFDVVVEPSGAVRVTHAVDASSDWAGIRVLPLVLPETLRAVVTSVMAVVGAPMDALLAALGAPRPPPIEMAPPSALSACSAMFEE